jgi:DNA-binding MarR family transcriptional regulator
VPSPLPIDPIAEARRQWIEHGWAVAADGMAAVTSIMRAQQIMLGRVESSLRPLGLSFARYELLTLLTFTRQGTLPMSSASARLQVHPTSVTSIVERLVADGLIEREPHPTDGRATLLVITDAGRRVAAEATAILNDDVFTSPPISAEDQAQLVRIIARLRRQVGDFEDPPAIPDPLY